MSRERNDSDKNRKIYVGNLPDDFSEKDLEQLFEKYGHVNSIAMKPAQEGRGTFGFVEFDDYRDAQEALEMDRREIEGRKILVEPHKGSRRDRGHPSRRSGSTLFVGNVAEDVTEQEIRDEFGRIGRLRDVRMGFRKAVDGRQHCFVDFEDQRDAEEAYDKLRDLKFNGLRIRLDFDNGPGSGRGHRFQPYSNRDRERNNRRSRSGSRGRRSRRSRSYSR